MYQRAGNTLQKESKSIASDLQSGSNGGLATQAMIDSRAAAVVQRKLQMLADLSGNVQRIVQMQAIADRYMQVHEAVNSSTTTIPAVQKSEKLTAIEAAPPKGNAIWQPAQRRSDARGDHGRPTVQRMAVSGITDLRQAGGTCGLYSLGMAMSGVDGTLAGRRNLLLRRLLVAANQVGTFVGEFMDADNLAVVARILGFNANVINFGDVNDMEAKLNGTGGAGTVMGYSVFDTDAGLYGDPQTRQNLLAFKYLFSHWSVVEALAANNITVRDPNAPGATRLVNSAVWHQSNQDADNPAHKFGFQEFQDKGVGDVGDLRTDWEGKELDQRGGHAVPRTPLDAGKLPKPKLNLAGKIVSVTGAMSLNNDPAPLVDRGEQSYLKSDAHLRDVNKTSIHDLKQGDVIYILDRNRAGKTFDLGTFSFKKEHFWVRTEDNTEGWVRRNAIVGA